MSLMLYLQPLNVIQKFKIHPSLCTLMHFRFHIVIIIKMISHCLESHIRRDQTRYLRSVCLTPLWVNPQVTFVPSMNVCWTMQQSVCACVCAFACLPFYECVFDCCFGCCLMFVLIFFHCFFSQSSANRIAPWVININIDIVDKRIVFPSNFHLPFTRRDSQQPTRWLIPPRLSAGSRLFR